MKIKDEILEYLIKASFNVTFNMNDTFYRACSDSCEMPSSDVLSMVELVEKYDYDAIIAYEAINRGHNPDIEQVVTESFILAKKEILERLSDTFCPRLYHQEKNLTEERNLFNGQLVQYKQYKRTFLDKIKSFLARESYKSIDQIAYLDSGESARGFNNYKAKNKLIEFYKNNHKGV